jgi:hypothetical protein
MVSLKLWMLKRLNTFVLIFEPQLGAYHVTIILFGTMNTYGLAYMKANMD